MHNLFARRNNDRDILSTIFRVDKSLFYVSKSWKSSNIIDTIKYQYKKLNMISQPRQTVLKTGSDSSTAQCESHVSSEMAIIYSCPVSQ